MKASDPFFALLPGGTLLPITCDVHELIAEWDTETDHRELFTTAISEDGIDPLFILRRTSGQWMDEDGTYGGGEPLGDTVLSEDDAARELDLAGVRLQSPLAEIAAKVKARAQQDEEEASKPARHVRARAKFTNTAEGPILEFETTATTATQPTHADDFAWIACQLGTFNFSPQQRPVVRRFWEAWERNEPGVSSATIMKLYGGSAARARDAFKDHPAWGHIIVRVRDGLYRLTLT